MGGTANLIYATLYPDDCTVVAALGAATDLGAYYGWGMKHEPGIQRQIAEAIAKSYGGTPEQKADLYRKHSPLFNADRLTMPLYLAHGEKDALMPVEQMRALAAKLSGRSGVAFAEIKGGNHDSPCFYGPAIEWLLQNALK
jgi:dipeptidyl aminopeptidase/acylaminoacyl peptidase